MNDERLEPMESEMSHNVLKKVIGSDTSCKEKHGREMADGCVGSLARLDAGIAAAVGCLTKRKSREDHRQKCYPDTYGKYLMLIVEQMIWTSVCIAASERGKYSARHRTRISLKSLFVHLQKKCTWL